MLRKESADTQEYESCQLNDMDVDMDENKQELSFIPIAVSDSAGWREPNIMCDRQFREERCPVLRHRISDGGREGRDAHDKPLPVMSQSEARRKEGASFSQHALEASSR